MCESKPGISCAGRMFKPGRNQSRNATIIRLASLDYIKVCVLGIHEQRSKLYNVIVKIFKFGK